MDKFTITETGINNLVVIQPRVFGDMRGYIMETYNAKEFSTLGLETNYVQDNQSRSTKGVLRGLHFQKNYPQGKLVRVIKGEIFDVAVDLRKDSITLGKWFGVFLSDENKKMFYVPKGFAHGFLVTSDTAEVVYKCTELYHPEDECGIIWNDEDLQINWPLKCLDGGAADVILSEKDRAWGNTAKFKFSHYSI